MEEKTKKPRKATRQKSPKNEWIPAKVIGCREFKVYDTEQKQGVIYEVNGGSVVEINPSMTTDEMVAVRRGSIRGYGEKRYLKGKMK